MRAAREHTPHQTGRGVVGAGRSSSAVMICEKAFGSEHPDTSFNLNKLCLLVEGKGTCSMGSRVDRLAKERHRHGTRAGLGFRIR